MNPRQRILVLGCGRVGGWMARQLAGQTNYKVVAADRDPQALQLLHQRSEGAVTSLPGIDFASSSVITAACRGFDLVIGAVPGKLGYAVMGAVIEAGVPMVDISFMPEDFRSWDPAARAAGIPVLADMGVSPGTTGLVAGIACTQLEQVHTIRIYVPGLPLHPVPPFQYRLVFSPDDVIEEYVRPARCRQGGRTVEYPALSQRHPIQFSMNTRTLPELEAFLTDGCRTLLDSLPVSTLEEYTMRWPGTAEKMAFLRDLGLFSQEPLSLEDGTSVLPRQLFRLLSDPHMQMRDGEGEFTFFEVVAEGLRKGKTAVLRFQQYVEGNTLTDGHSMARATGCPALIAARWILTGKWTSAGVHPPEAIGMQPLLAEGFLEELAAAGMPVEIQQA
jgi:lysine 6-dehydrogenase